MVKIELLSAENAKTKHTLIACEVVAVRIAVNNFVTVRANLIIHFDMFLF